MPQKDAATIMYSGHQAKRAYSTITPSTSYTIFCPKINGQLTYALIGDCYTCWYPNGKEIKCCSPDKICGIQIDGLYGIE